MFTVAELMQCVNHLILHYSKEEKMVMENFKLYQKCKLLAHGNATDLDFLFPHIRYLLNNLKEEVTIQQHNHLQISV